LVRGQAKFKFRTLRRLRRRIIMVARWFIFIPKIPIWVFFGGPWTGKCCHILWPFGIFYGNLVHFMAVWYI
jgi:hypothetical protein